MKNSYKAPILFITLILLRNCYIIPQQLSTNDSAVPILMESPGQIKKPQSNLNSFVQILHGFPDLRPLIPYPSTDEDDVYYGPLQGQQSDFIYLSQSFNNQDSDEVWLNLLRSVDQNLYNQQQQKYTDSSQHIFYLNKNLNFKVECVYLSKENMNILKGESKQDLIDFGSQILMSDQQNREQKEKFEHFVEVFTTLNKTELPPLPQLIQQQNPVLGFQINDPLSNTVRRQECNPTNKIDWKLAGYTPLPNLDQDYITPSIIKKVFESAQELNSPVAGWGCEVVKEIQRYEVKKKIYENLLNFENNIDEQIQKYLEMYPDINQSVNNIQPEINIRYGIPRADLFFPDHKQIVQQYRQFAEELAQQMNSTIDELKTYFEQVKMDTIVVNPLPPISEGGQFIGIQFDSNQTNDEQLNSTYLIDPIPTDPIRRQILDLSLDFNFLPNGSLLRFLQPGPPKRPKNEYQQGGQQPPNQSNHGRPQGGQQGQYQEQGQPRQDQSQSELNQNGRPRPNEQQSGVQQGGYNGGQRPGQNQQQQSQEHNDDGQRGQQSGQENEQRPNDRGNDRPSQQQQNEQERPQGQNENQQERDQHSDEPHEQNHKSYEPQGPNDSYEKEEPHGEDQEVEKDETHRPEGQEENRPRQNDHKEQAQYQKFDTPAITLNQIVKQVREQFGEELIFDSQELNQILFEGAQFSELNQSVKLLKSSIQSAVKEVSHLFVLSYSQKITINNKEAQHVGYIPFVIRSPYTLTKDTILEIALVDSTTGQTPETIYDFIDYTIRISNKEDQEYHLQFVLLRDLQNAQFAHAMIGGSNSQTFHGFFKPTIGVEIGVILVFRYDTEKRTYTYNYKLVEVHSSDPDIQICKKFEYNLLDKVPDVEDLTEQSIKKYQELFLDAKNKQQQKQKENQNKPQQALQPQQSKPKKKNLCGKQNSEGELCNKNGECTENETGNQVCKCNEGFLQPVCISQSDQETLMRIFDFTIQGLSESTQIARDLNVLTGLLQTGGIPRNYLLLAKDTVLAYSTKLFNDVNVGEVIIDLLYALSNAISMNSDITLDEKKISKEEIKTKIQEYFQNQGKNLRSKSEYAENGIGIVSVPLNDTSIIILDNYSNTDSNQQQPETNNQTETSETPQTETASQNSNQTDQTETEPNNQIVADQQNDPGAQIATESTQGTDTNGELSAGGTRRLLQEQYVFVKTASIENAGVLISGASALIPVTHQSVIDGYRLQISTLADEYYDGLVETDNLASLITEIQFFHPNTNDQIQIDEKNEVIQLTLGLKQLLNVYSEYKPVKIENNIIKDIESKVVANDFSSVTFTIKRGGTYSVQIQDVSINQGSESKGTDLKTPYSASGTQKIEEITGMMTAGPDSLEVIYSVLDLILSLTWLMFILGVIF